MCYAAGALQELHDAFVLLHRVFLFLEQVVKADPDGLAGGMTGLPTRMHGNRVALAGSSGNQGAAFRVR